ncbi:MAG: UDP-glucose/GDP-mannose dehydrogenase family protein [Nanoarchaeota archaeon]|nr:UDP-glucose/GDP-mannose dehydrogenase family protein [Nanoarchaeota archaeon]MBU1005575.1 UDP-glucose/GDP-mannose dehydrogenase family protein [Nanoarchaeota archaeon]
MKIAVIGTGYVGLTVGTCLANLGNEVMCVDVDSVKIDNLNKGIIPIYEPGLKELVDRNVKEKRLFFTISVGEAIQKSDVVFIAVGTPQKEDNRADLSYVENVAKDIGKYINSYKVIVDKSTVPVGTADRVKEIISENQEKKIDFDVVSNPEFLREGKAIKDFFNPDRVVIGVDSDKAKKVMTSLYKPLERTDKPIIFTDIKSAELIKYASNAFLTTKISFINELSHLAEKVGADIKSVAKGMGLDSRIGVRFLQAGVGYGGSCFPKDARALIETMKENKCSTSVLDAVESVNEAQKLSIISKIKKLLGNLNNKKIAIWGLSFKPNTDDIREAPSVTIISELQKEGAKIRVFDPVAMNEAKKILKNVEYGEDSFDALIGCDALVIVTEWDEFRELDKEKMKKMLKQPNIIDGRNIYEPSEMKKSGFNYVGVGR